MAYVQDQRMSDIKGSISTEGVSPSSFDEQWEDAPHAPGCVHAKYSPAASEAGTGPTMWNWVMIAVMVGSLAWYISKLPETLGLQ